LLITLNNVTMHCEMEVDKVVSNFAIEGGTFDNLLFQSSSGSALFTMNNATVITLNGTPEKALIANSTIGTLVAGTLWYGRTTEIACTSCNIGSFKNPPGGVMDMNVDTKYTMNGGIITVPNSRGPVGWAVPGANAVFALYYGELLNEGVPFTITDLTQDSSNTYIQTSLSGGFPLLPTEPTTGLSIYGHPAPKFTCTNCTGSADSVDLAQATPGAPIFSYSKRTYTGNIGTAPRFTMWGEIVKIAINVRTPYTGTQPSFRATSP
jgi:hypothetical protein